MKRPSWPTMAGRRELSSASTIGQDSAGPRRRSRLPAPAIPSRFFPSHLHPASTTPLRREGTCSGKSPRCLHCRRFTSRPLTLSILQTTTPRPELRGTETPAPSTQPVSTFFCLVACSPGPILPSCWLWHRLLWKKQRHGPDDARALVLVLLHCSTILAGFWECRLSPVACRPEVLLAASRRSLDGRQTSRASEWPDWLQVVRPTRLQIARAFWVPRPGAAREKNLLPTLSTR